MKMSEETRGKMHLRGVYAIVNIADGKQTTYVGSTARAFRLRLYTHKALLKTNKHPNRHLQSAYNKYGKGAFAFEILEVIANEQQVTIQEQYWLDCYEAKGPIYNYGAVAPTPMLGVKHTEEARKKISNGLRGKPRSEEVRRQITERNMGKKYSEGTRRKQSLAHKGKCNWSEFQRQRIHEVLKGNQNRAVDYPALINIYTGERIESGRCVKRLCRKMGFNFPSFFDLLKERRSIYRGWILEKNHGQCLF